MQEDKLNFSIDYSTMPKLECFGSDKPEYPLILSIPHSGEYFPPELLKQINCSKDILRRNEDLLVDVLLKKAIANGITAIKMPISRVFVDVNRDRLEMDPAMFYNYPANQNVLYDKHCRVGFGVIHRINYLREPLYKGLLDYNEVLLRIKNVYDGYHKKLQQLINKCLKKFGFCLVLDCHSMPSKICSIIDDRSGIDICLGNLFSQSCPQEMSDFLARQFWDKNYNVEFNCPYSGAYITFNYCQPRQKIYTLQLEINRSLYSIEDKLKPNNQFNAVAEDISDSIISLAQNIRIPEFSL